MREGGEPAPYRSGAHSFDHGGRKADRLDREEDHRVVAAAFANQRREALVEVVRRKRPCPVDHVRRLVDGEPLDWQPLHRRFNGEHRARGVAEWDAPDNGKQANWLPTPDGRFRPPIRMYQPRAEILTGEYILPAFNKAR